MQILRLDIWMLLCILHPECRAGAHLAEVPHMAGFPIASVVSSYFSNIMVKPFSMTITHCSDVQREEVKVGG